MGGIEAKSGCCDIWCRGLRRLHGVSGRRPGDVEGVAEALVEMLARLDSEGSPAYADEARWAADAERAFDRCFDPAGVGRQFFAVQASGSRADALRNVTVPTLVMQGTADTLIDISGGRRTAEPIPGARFVALEGMGHDYPRQFWQQWVGEVAGFCLAA